MSDAEWAAKYSRQKRTPEDEPLLAGFNWKTVRILSSSTLSSQDTSLVQLVLKVEHPDGKSTHETLELTAPELRDFIASIEQVAAVV